MPDPARRTRPRRRALPVVWRAMLGAAAGPDVGRARGDRTGLARGDRRGELAGDDVDRVARSAARGVRVVLVRRGGNGVHDGLVRSLADRERQPGVPELDAAGLVVEPE